MTVRRQDTGSAQVVDDNSSHLPSWLVGICGVAAVASALFTILLFLNR